jgi:ubiquinone/menaquinone biosynthesis C-methylase UbiE/DNA-binding HxlR family transcriptional regulator
LWGKPEWNHLDYHIKISLYCSMTDILSAFKAVADGSRLRMLVLLAQAELAVTDLTHLLRQSQPRVSRHLKVLTDAGLIERHKEGAWVFYRLASAGAAGEVAHALSALAQRDSSDIARDAERLAELMRERAAAADAYFATNAASWDALRSMHVSEAEVERAMMAALISRKPKSLLDIGTGTGRVLEVMAPHIERGMGIDVSREMLNMARVKLEQKQIGHCQVRQGDMYDLPKDAGGFDAITFHQVLHYADDPRAAVMEAAKVLSPRGRILVVDFAPHDKDYLREEQAHRRLGFTDDQVLGWMREAGLDAEVLDHLRGGDLTVTVWAADKLSEGH